MMKTSLQSPRLLGVIAVGAALGAATMFVLDPNKGRRRRALLRDQARRSLLHVGRLVRLSARDFGHRTRGVGATIRRLFKRRRVTDDLVLIERVRAKMGRVVSHPHAIQIGAHDGRVTLSGPILPDEAGPLLATARSVWGVSDVEDHLMIFDRPESIPSLQGRRRNPRVESRTDALTSVARIAALVGGGALALCAIRASGATRIALAAASAGLTAGGAASGSLSRTARVARRRGKSAAGVPVDEHLDVPSAAPGAHASLH